jgi:hypothetical protein
MNKLNKDLGSFLNKQLKNLQFLKIEIFTMATISTDHDDENVDMVKRPQLMSVIEFKKEPTENGFKEIGVDDLLLHEYHKVLMRIDREQYIDSEKMPKGYKVINVEDQPRNEKIEIFPTEHIMMRNCSNCRESTNIVKSVYTDIFVIHLCRDCMKAYNFPLGDLMDFD